MGATRSDGTLEFHEVFQFTHPCGCDLMNPGRPFTGKGFNSRTRVGATVQGGESTFFLSVSIHAPGWVRPSASFGIFPHTSCFNSRTRVGATFRLDGGGLCFDVSIHAPVWVRLVKIFYETPEEEFQFTHPCGCDRRT